jgi:hypothetical protein
MRLRGRGTCCKLAADLENYPCRDGNGSDIRREVRFSGTSGSSTEETL